MFWIPAVLVIVPVMIEGTAARILLLRDAMVSIALMCVCT